MRYKGYNAKVEHDRNKGIYRGEVAGIRDVVTFEGKSVEKARRAFRESVDDYLAFCKQRGEKPNRTVIR